MKLVPGRQGFAREELHLFDPLEHPLGFTQRQFVSGCENTVPVIASMT